MDAKHAPKYGVYSEHTPAGSMAQVDGQANARLIAAAPELLAALRKLAADCDGGTLGTVKAPRWAVLCAAESAIADAEGRA